MLHPDGKMRMMAFVRMWKNFAMRNLPDRIRLRAKFVRDALSHQCVQFASEGSGDEKKGQSCIKIQERGKIYLQGSLVFAAAPDWSKDAKAH
jgi:hypothetical protein